MERILLVAIAKELVEQLGKQFSIFAFDVVETASEALRSLATGRFAGALVGETPPDLPGSEVIRRAREMLQLTELPMELVANSDWDALQTRISPLLERAAKASGLDAPTEGTQERWNNLVEQFRRLTAARIMDLRRVQTAIGRGDMSAALSDTAQRAVHNIAGSATLFGHPEATRLARRIEDLLTAGDMGALEASFPGLVAELEVQLGLRPATEPPPELMPRSLMSDEPPTADAHKSGIILLHVDDDPALNKAVQMVAGPQGVTVLAAETPAQAREFLRTHRPDSVVIDLTFPGDEEAVFSLVDEIRQMQPLIPLVVLTPNGHLEQRLQAARMGANRFLQKPVAPAEIVSTATQLVTYVRRSRATVLAVDDDPMILNTLRELLSPLQINVVGCSDPYAFWQVLEDSKPELVLLDVEMGNLSGLDLCRVLRSDRQYQSIPVIFLTSRSDVETLASAFEAGADDFIGKPILGPEIAARVHGRLERTRLMRQLAENDPLTGAFNRRKFTDLVGRYIRLADRQRLPLSAAIIDIDRFKLVNDTYGHLVGDAVLQRLVGVLKAHLRAEDIVARWGGEEFAVVMMGSTKAGAIMRLTRVMEAFRSDLSLEAIRPTYSAGIAEYPRDGVNLMELQKVADVALYQAKSAGRARVFAAGAVHQELQQFDVVIVDDDEVEGALMLASLEKRGLTVRWYRDEAPARNALAGTTPTCEARVVLVDTDLPGTGGMGLLRILRERGVLAQTRVLLVTSHSSDAEMLEGLSAGAFDYISKPVTSVAMTERVRRALEG